MPIGGRVYIALYYGDQIPQNTILGAGIGAFKANAQNIPTSLYESHCSDSNQILHNDEDF